MRTFAVAVALAAMLAVSGCTTVSSYDPATVKNFEKLGEFLKKDRVATNALFDKYNVPAADRQGYDVRHDAMETLTDTSAAAERKKKPLDAPAATTATAGSK